MKSKKGFTMIELLAAIVIVGILASAGVVGVINLRKNQEVKYNQTQNNMFVETAKTYFSDNKQYLPTKPGAAENVYVTLGELIEANYITEEFLDYNGEQYDKDSKVQVLRIDKGVYTYRGSLFQDGTEVATTEKADLEWSFSYKNKTGNLNKINNKNYTNSTPSMEFKATSKNGIHLLAYMYTIYRDGVVHETSEMIYLGKKIEANDELELDLESEKYSGDARYKIKITLYDESGYELTKTGEEIVVDTVPPKAPQLVNLYENKWINKSYEIKGTAYDSSGIAEWQHTYKLDAREDDWKKYNDSAKSSFTTTSFTDEMDKYVYIRVCDYATNCSDSAKSKIKIDKTAPICNEPTGGNPSWINATSSVNERIITATCDDSKKGDTHSGCAENSISYTYSKDIDTKEAGAAGNKQGGIVRDIAGNTTKCKANQTVRIDKTLPTKPVLDNPNDNVWVNKVKFNSSGFSYTIKGTTKENLSGVDYWQYTYSNDAEKTGSDADNYWKTYANSAMSSFTTTPFKEDRKQNVYIRVCDKAGNCSKKSASMIMIDTKPPTTPVYTDKAKLDVWTKDSYQIGIRSMDATSGVVAFKYKYTSNTQSGDNGHNGSDYGTFSQATNKIIKNGVAYSQTPNAFSKDRNSGISIIACDEAGNCSSDAKGKVMIDTKPPRCEVSGGNTAWISTKTADQSRVIKAHCVDDKNKSINADSSCATADFSKTYSADINTSEAGAVGLKNGGTVKDKAGNIGTCSANQTVKIDKTAPSCSSWNGESTSWARSRTISVGCTDSGSQCENSSYSVASYSRGTVKTANLSQTIKDRAGNTKTCSKNNVNIYVDNDGPSKPNISLYKSSVRDGFNTALGYTSSSWANTEVMTRSTSTDDGSGIAYYQYSHDGAGWSNSITSLGWSAAYYNSNTMCDFWINWEGEWNFYIRAVDNLGNVSPVSDMFNIRIDRTAPTCVVEKTSLGTTSGVSTGIRCNDAFSKCSAGNPTSETGVKSSKTYTVYDNAGNAGSCSVSVSSQTQYNLGNRCDSSRRGCKDSVCTSYKYSYTKTHTHTQSKTAKACQELGGSGIPKKKCGSGVTNNDSNLCCRWYTYTTETATASSCPEGKSCTCAATKCTKYKCDGGKCGWGGWTTTACTPASDCTIGGKEVCCQTRVVYN